MRHLSDTVGGVSSFYSWGTGNRELKGHKFVSGVGLPSAFGCKDPVRKKDLVRSFFIFFSNSVVFFVEFGYISCIHRRNRLESEVNSNQGENNHEPNLIFVFFRCGHSTDPDFW